MEKDLRPTSQHLAPVMVNFMSYQTLGHGLPLMNFPDTTPELAPFGNLVTIEWFFPLNPVTGLMIKASRVFFFFLLFLVLGDSDDI